MKAAAGQQKIQSKIQRLKSNEDMVLAAVSQNGLAFCFASPNLQSKKEVAIAALSQAGKPLLPYVSKELKKDKAVINAALSCKS